MKKTSVFIAATGQHVGKTTTCLGLLAGLRSRFQRVGFLKPVGQQHLIVDGNTPIDKDVILFKKCFNLPYEMKMMSPVIVARNFTREYLDGMHDSKELENEIIKAYQAIADESDCVVVEGTGHVGVGEIIDLNNAKVAKLLGTKMIIIAPGGLGSSFDTLALNIEMCRQQGIEVAGVILNRVLPDKKDTIEKYMGLALKRWNIPILGIIPYDPFLSQPCMKDFEFIFNVSLISGESHRLRHFTKMRLVATSVDHYRNLICKGQLIITPATRDDIISATLERHWQMKYLHPDEDLENGIILTGSHPPKQALLDEIQKADIPTLYAPVNSFEAMKKITSHTTKIRTDDTEKIHEAMSLMEKHLNFDLIEKILK